MAQRDDKLCGVLNGITVDPLRPGDFLSDKVTDVQDKNIAYRWPPFDIGLDSR
jgi:hypothetical protein